ncbi:MAG: hypothetical protein K9I94_12395 [Bacteroidales bacterium]|nr:hypothetical protein [Bacteroidales bacterium]
MEQAVESRKTTRQQQAYEIIEEVKEELFHILWNTDHEEFCSSKFLLPWLEEQAEEEIKSLGLPKEKENYYIEELGNALGDYAEDQPDFKHRKQ